jgi:hypothetical protein
VFIRSLINIQGSLPYKSERSRNFDAVRGSKYALAAEEQGAKEAI